MNERASSHGKNKGKASQQKGPPWRWWGRGGEELSLRHAIAILRRAGPLEELVYAGGPPLDRALRRYQQDHRNMGRADRLLLGQALYGLARNRDLFRLALPEAIPGDGLHLILALLDAQRGDIGLIPHLPGGVVPWLQALERTDGLRRDRVRAVEKAWDEPAHALGTEAAEACACLFSVPSWWLRDGPWERLGEAVEEIARLKRQAGLVLRAQAQGRDRDDVLGELRSEGIAASPTPRSPWGIRVQGRDNVLARPAYREGRVEVQDEGSQLAACLCDPKPGERVLDLCAGGGGKTLALAAAQEGKGTVVAHDADARRLTDTRRRARRAGLGNIRVVEDAARVDSLGPYDLVLADVPCSSSGTLRRNPDVAWRWGGQDLLRLTQVQADILDRAAGLVRPGGLLVYATCSLLEPENTRQCARFQERHPEFRPAPPGERRAHQALRDIPGADTGIFRIPANLPNYDGDAFFLARFRRL